MYNYDSFYKNYANQSLDWLPLDTKELYQDNLINRYNDLKFQGWLDTHFTYKFNSTGFRCKEFSQDPTAMFLGGSDTIGIGLPVDAVWPEIISKKLNMQCANFGIGGASPDTLFRLCHGYIDKIKPKIVVCMITPGIRFETVDNNNVYNNMVKKNVNHEFYKHWAIDENNNYFNQEKNILAIKMLCSERGIKCVFTDSKTLFEVANNSLARDLMHRGLDAHRLFANMLVSKI